eukprot:GHRQ01026918.1.p1 GENE.GHRQ01026918.1~~GHRQ01026918.1.p1  ORF type:complete len:172 (-),score=87.31 GHRQ01026918.1:139-654(-)
MTGDGSVTKKRLREGHGDFPVDCPLHDTTVRLHYRVRSLAGGSPGPWLYDSLQASSSSSTAEVAWGAEASAACAAAAAAAGGASDEGSDEGSDAGEAGQASTAGAGADAAAAEGCVEADTGAGELPEGLEMCVKLMVPGEVASASCQPKYAYLVSPDEAGAGATAWHPVRP